MSSTNIIDLPVGPSSEVGAGATAGGDEIALPAEQLDLGLTTADGRPLRPSRLHARFRLDERTRQRGLRHVAEIRARLAVTDGHVDDATIVAFPDRGEVGTRAS